MPEEYFYPPRNSSHDASGVPAGDVLPRSVHHAEAAVRPEAAAHGALRSGRSGPGSGSRQLLRERTAVSERVRGTRGRPEPACSLSCFQKSRKNV